MIGPENLHTCRQPPFEAAIYSLEAKGDVQNFRSNCKAELTVEVETSHEHQEKKKEHSSVELPVDFSKEGRTLTTNFQFLFK